MTRSDTSPSPVETLDLSEAEILAQLPGLTYCLPAEPDPDAAWSALMATRRQLRV